MEGFPQRGSPELPDIFSSMSQYCPDEFVPVEHFFQSYIEELNSRSKRTHEPGGDGMSKAVKLSAGQTAGAMHPAMLEAQAGMADSMRPPYMAAVPPQMGQPSTMMHDMQVNGSLSQMLMAQQAGVAGGVPMGMMSGVGAGGGLPEGFGMPSATTPAPYMPVINGGMEASATGPMMGLDMQMGSGYGGGYGGASAGPPPPTAQLSGGPTVDSHGGGGSQGCDSKQRKTVKQQEANKVAQQRYRERKKQRFHEMEAQIGELSKQLAELQAMQSRNQILEGLNGDLQSQLASKEREVERLKLALDVAAECSLGSHSNPSSPSADGERGMSAARELATEASHTMRTACDLLPQDMAGIDFKKGFADQVVKLRQFVEQHHLTAGATPDHGLSDSDMMALGQLVARSCQLCQAALRAEGVRVIELISKDPGSFSTVDTAAEVARWGGCLAVMHLTPEQHEDLLLSRRRHLQCMHTIYQERQSLNMQAMSLMLPHASKNPAEDNTVEGRMANMSSAGYLRVAKSSAELGDVLDKIKDNLRREQRAVMDLNCQLIAKTLTPLQAAHYMLKAYPQHCDALALSNTLAKQLGREEFSDRPPMAGGPTETSTGCQQQQVGCC